MKLRKNDLWLDGRHRREGLRSGERPVTLPTSFFYEGMPAAIRLHPEVLQQEVMRTRRKRLEDMLHSKQTGAVQGLPVSGFRGSLSNLTIPQGLALVGPRNQSVAVPHTWL